MEEIITTEHCFNLNDAEHIKGTSRYVFDYPEIWYVNQTIKDMSMGIRSIILKPAPIYTNAIKLYVLGDNMENEKLIRDANKLVLNNKTVYPHLMEIDIRKNVDERIDMLQFVNWANEKIIADIDHHMDIVESGYDNLTMCDLTRYSCYFEYSDEGTLMFTANENSNLCIKMTYNEATTGNLAINVFTKGFHQLLGLDYNNEDTNINCYISALLKAARDNESLIPNIIKNMNNNGIQIIAATPQRKSSTDLTDFVVYGGPEDDCPLIVEYDVAAGVKSGTTYDYPMVNVKFKGIIVSNVWSRKDVLLRSSIAEMDKRGYIGFSSNYSNSSQAIYPQPKIYDVTNTNSKFWVELYDSYNQKAINMLDGNMLLIEAIVCQKPKRTFNRT